MIAYNHLQSRNTRAIYKPIDRQALSLPSDRLSLLAKASVGQSTRRKEDLKFHETSHASEINSPRQNKRFLFGHAETSTSQSASTQLKLGCFMTMAAASCRRFSRKVFRASAETSGT
jgi:hypothetical protein